VPHRGFQTLTIALDLSRRGLVRLADRQFQQLCVIADGARDARDLLDVAGEAGALAAQFLGAGRVRPDGRIL
jgi:hypothetical protein